MAENSRPAEVDGGATTYVRLRPWAYAVVGASISAYVVLRWSYAGPLGHGDFDQVWYAARALMGGLEPYAAIGPGDPSRFRYPLYYPLPALLTAVPFTPFSISHARLLFAMTTGGLFGYAIGRHRPWLWPAFFSMSFILVAQSVQWACLVVAGMLLPWLGPIVAVAKVNLGAAMLAWTPTARAALILVLGCLLLVAISLVVEPLWPVHWLRALRTSQHLYPLIARPFGFLMLVGLIRWWDPDARLLVALSIVPQTGLLYDALPACLVAKTRKEAAIIALGTHVGWFAGALIPPVETFAEVSWYSGALVLWSGLALPLVIVLRRGLRRPLSRSPGDPDTLAWPITGEVSNSR